MTGIGNPSDPGGITAVRILLVEGGRVQASGLPEILASRGWGVERAQERGPLPESADEFDLVVLDSTGLDVECLELLKGASGAAGPEVVVLGDPELSGYTEAPGERPFHFVGKTDEKSRLIAVIEVALRLRRLRLENRELRTRLEETRERRAAHRLARFQAHHDPVTGLPNRTLLNDRLEFALVQAQRNERRLALMFLDLDGFKAINDSLGHALGDRLLVAVAERLQGCVRRSDTLARFGGDEFALLLPDMSAPEDAALIAGKLLGTLEAPFVIGGRRLSIGASVGIAMYPENGELREVLVRKADIAMYRVKERGKNAYRFYEEETDSDHTGPLAAKREIQAGLVRGELEVHYIPQVSLAEGCIRSLEAQWRWRHPERGLIAPTDRDRGFPAAGYSAEVDGFLRRQALRQAAEWRRAGCARLAVALNVAAWHFDRPGFAEQFAGDVRAAGLDTNAVAVQVDEEALMQGAEILECELGKLSELGVRVVACEFGAGFSSLRYLDRLAIAGLKLSSLLLHDLDPTVPAAGPIMPQRTPAEGEPDTEAGHRTVADRSESGARTIAAISAVARELNLDLAATGVRTLDQLRFLKSCGVSEADGPVFSPALPVAEIDKLIGENPFTSFVRV